MGCYDTVYAYCPNCDQRVEFQSKAHACNFHEYHVSLVPTEIALDLNGRKEVCKCGQTVTIRCSVPIHVTMVVDQTKYNGERDD